MISFKQNGLRALRQMSRAIHRGDLEAAFAWTVVADRQVRMARCISDLERRVHRPWPLPPKADPLTAKSQKAAPLKSPPAKKATDPAPAATTGPSCPHSRLPSACFCNRGKAD
jgi:hypothetical protein